MSASRYISVLTAVVLCVTSCIRENIDECETPVELRFRYWGNGIVDIFPERIDSVLMFIYEMPSGTLHSAERITAEALDTLQGAGLRLFPGDYRIVCWGNAGEGSYIDAGAGKIMAPESRDPENDENSTGIEDLYFGYVDLSVPLTLRPVRDTLEYESSYIMMTVELIGFGSPDVSGAAAGQENSHSGIRTMDESAPSVRLVHSDLSAYIDFGNRPSDETADYEPELRAHPERNDSYVADYMVPEFDNGTASVLNVSRRGDGTVIYSRPLSEILDELGITIDTDRQEQQVRLRLVASVGDDGLVSVDVMGWNTEIVFPDF